MLSLPYRACFFWPGPALLTLERLSLSLDPASQASLFPKPSRYFKEGLTAWRLGWNEELRLPHFNQQRASAPLAVALGNLLSGLPGLWCFKISGKSEFVLAVFHFLDCGNRFFLIPRKLELETGPAGSLFGERFQESGEREVRLGRYKNQPRECQWGSGASESDMPQKGPQNLACGQWEAGVLTPSSCPLSVKDCS